MRKSKFSEEQIAMALHHREASRFHGKVFMQRVLGTYGFTLVISALLLFGIGRLSLFEDPVVAVNRTVLVAFSASFAATVVDSVGDRPAG